jgi:O-antigen/teichoic acid export membrane protein
METQGASSCGRLLVDRDTNACGETADACGETAESRVDVVIASDCPSSLLVNSLRRLWSRLGLLGRPSRSVTGISASLIASQLIMAATGIMSARWLGPSGKGLVAAATTWGQLLAWFAGLGIAIAIQVRLAEAPTTGKAAVTSTALGNGLLYSAVAGTGIGLVAFFPVAHALTHLGPESNAAVAWAILPLPLGVLAPVLAYVQLALGRNRIYSMSLVLGPMTTFALAFAAIAVGELSPVVLICCYLVGSVAALSASARQLPWESIHVDLAVLWQDIRYGVRVWLSSVMMLVNVRLDILVMTTFLSARDIGLYSAANNVMLPVSSIPAVIALIATPNAARLQVQGGPGSAAAAIWRSSRQAFILSLAGGFVLAVAAPVVVPLVLGDAYRPSIPIIWILIAGNVARSVMAVVVAGANGMRRPRAGYVSEGIGLAATLILLAVLLPRWGITGAAAASSVSYCLSAAASLWWLLLARRSSMVATGREGQHGRDVIGGGVA